MISEVAGSITANMGELKDKYQSVNEVEKQKSRPKGRLFLKLNSNDQNDN